MAIAATTEYSKGVRGDHRYWEGLLTFDSSYPTGGEVVAPSLFAMNNIDFVSVGNAGGVTDRIPYWSRVSGSSHKLVLVDLTTEAEVVNASDQSSVTVHVVVHGH